MLLATLLLASTGPAELTGLLDDVKKKPKGAAVVVFDLDTALFSADERMKRILVETAASTPRLRWLEDRLWALPTDLPPSVDAILAQIGLKDAQDLEPFRAAWARKINDDDYLAFDTPRSAAVEYAAALYDAGATLLYVSERDVARMGAGTVSTLRRYGLPAGTPRAILALRSDGKVPLPVHEAETLDLARRLGKVVGAFSADAARAGAQKRAFGAAKVFLVRPFVPGRKDTPGGVIEVADYRRIEGAPSSTAIIAPVPTPKALDPKVGEPPKDVRSP